MPSGEGDDADDAGPGRKRGLWGRSGGARMHDGYRLTMHLPPAPTIRESLGEGMFSLPEMLFDQSSVVLTHEASGLSISLTARDALKEWRQEALPPLQVTVAKVVDHTACLHLSPTCAPSLKDLLSPSRPDAFLTLPRHGRHPDSRRSICSRRYNSSTTGPTPHRTAVAWCAGPPPLDPQAPHRQSSLCGRRPRSR
jgi:hypothetical protein